MSLYKQIIIALLAWALLGWIARADQDGVIDLGDRRAMLVDETLIEKLEGDADLRLHRPEDRGVVITNDEPWEGNTSAYHTIFRDGDRYRMYYRGWHHEGGKAMHPETVCYAESPDGIDWTKPKLGLVEFNGSKQNNIIWMGKGSHNFVPFRDDNPNCKPAEKYKAVAGGTGEGGLYGFVSSDGVRWELIQKKPVLPASGWALDSQNVVFWDAVRGEYRLYYRTVPNKVRSISTATSKDFINWSPGQLLVYPDAPTEQLYTNQIQPYHRAPDLFIGFPARFLNPQVEPLFMTSRDGVTFKRWPDTIVPAGDNPDKAGNRSNYAWCGIVETKVAPPGQGTELSIYTSERYYRGPGSRVRRYTYRLDGFVSVHAPASGGVITTKPVTFDGNVLRLNYATGPDGSIKVELLEADGKVVATVTGNGDRTDGVALKGLAKYAGRPVQLRFTLKDADLYAFRFAAK